MGFVIALGCASTMAIIVKIVLSNQGNRGI